VKANCWISPNKVEVQEVPDPAILNGRDAIVKITSTAICGSDLHLLDGYVPTMQEGDVMGHEFMGEVVEVGPAVDRDKLRVGDRIVVPFPIGCGACFACQNQLWSCCENTNPNAGMAEKMFGHPLAGIYGYSHLTGGFAGGQAEYARVVLADVNPLKIESDLTDEQVLFLSDILPTGYMGAEMCDITDGDIVAVWGAGPVGQFAMDSARVLGAANVIAIDDVPYRLEMAAAQGYQTIDYSDTDVRSALLELTGGRGPDKCIDAVGLEATHGAAHVQVYDRVKQAVRSETDRPHALRQAITCCRSGGIVSVIGVYGGFVDKFPVGSWMNRALTLKTGQCHVQRYMRPLLERIQNGELDPTRVITHRLPLAEAPHGYEIFKHKQDRCEKVVLKP
jgi:threonine dehydrogenase-like Zn-dependent dehydrogenase